MPLTVGGGVRTVADIRAAAGRRRQGLDQFGGGGRPDFVAEAADKFGDQCIVVAIDAKAGQPARPRWEIFTHGGRKPPASMPSSFARRSCRSAPAKSCSPRWTATAPRSATTSS
jgi:cyclase